MCCTRTRTRTSLDTCYLCPDETWPIFQLQHSAISAPLIEIFMWMNCDPDGEGPRYSTNVFPHKKQLTEAFFPANDLKQSHLIKGAIVSPLNWQSFFIFSPMRKESLMVSSIWEENCSECWERYRPCVYSSGREAVTQHIQGGLLITTRFSKGVRWLIH